MRKLCLIALAASLAAPVLMAQDVVPAPSLSVVPHFIRYSGALPDAPASASVVEARFALYGAQTGGEALWTETQQVALDPASKYAVVLGANSAAGLPRELFANGDARWLGVKLAGQPESARTLLTAAAYSLKASDAETLGGHPSSDFVLASAKPNAGVDITHITAGTGIDVSGNGTATVTVGIDQPYLDGLATQFAVKNGGNTLNGNQVINGSLTLNGTQVVNKIMAGGAVDVSRSGSVYTISLDGPQGKSFGDTYWAQLAAANTFSAMNKFNGGLSASSAGTAMTGTTSGTATGNAGVQGIATNGFSGTGVYGLTGTASLQGPATITNLDGTAGVWGDSGTSSTAIGIAVLGTEDDGVAGVFASNGTDYYTLVTANFDAGGYLFNAVNVATDAYCDIDPAANLVCSGSITGSNTTDDGRKVESFAVESSEQWIEDFGSAHLSHGAASVALEHTFASIVNTGVEYHVFLTPEGDSEHLFVTNKGVGGFEVREAKGGTSDIAFSYRIVAKRKGHESARLTEVPKGPTAKEHGRSLAATPVGMAREMSRNSTSR